MRPRCVGAATRRASSRDMEASGPHGRAAVRCGMLPQRAPGATPQDCSGPCPRGRLAAEGDGMKKPKARLDAWADAQKRFHLSDLHIQMARELGCAA